MVETRGVLRLSANPLPCEWRVIYCQIMGCGIGIKKGPAAGARSLFDLTIGDAAALLRAPLLGFFLGGFLGLGEEVDLLGNDLAAVTVGAILIGPFRVVDTPCDHDHRALGDLLCDEFVKATEACGRRTL